MGLIKFIIYIKPNSNYTGVQKIHGHETKRNM